ncbi:uncharacterized protein METZ01_LOCUS315968 [marine metagenome]|uniref:Uncharacterized protein n=1 Tax=marine metagenome TaxID=408172 RepID=A0A382NPK8_9ZZZZ
MANCNYISLERMLAEGLFLSVSHTITPRHNKKFFITDIVNNLGINKRS